jgi:transcriptional regulator with XRE-family HTH domain
MKTKQSFAKALKKMRKARGLTQEDFSVISSRTYISMLERGLKSPTLEKIEALAGLMKVHPMTLLALTYVKSWKAKDIDALSATVRNELYMIIEYS